MILIKSKNKLLFLLLTFLLISEIIVNPAGNYCLNDDWTYAKSVLKLFLGQNFDIGASSASIWTHLMWGLLFTKVFGFSLVILRLSTIVSAIISMVVLYRLILKITHQHHLTAFTGCFILLFNPIYFNLTNSYMTDVNFNTLIICCCWFAYNFFTGGSKIYFYLVFISALFLVLLRQFGVIVPLSMTLACLFLKEKKLVYTLMSLVLTFVIIFIFKYYEHYLEVNHCAEGYQFSSKVAILDRAFWNKLSLAFQSRYLQLIVNTVIFTLPFLIVFLPSLLQRNTKWIVALITVFSFIVGFYFFYGKTYLIGNVFVNMNCGAETFFQTLTPDFREAQAHTYNHSFEHFFSWATAISVSLYLLVILLLISYWLRKPDFTFNLSPSIVFFTSLIFLYMLTLLFFDSYIDRYNIPLFTLFIVLFSFLSRHFKANMYPAIFFMFVLYYISVSGTKDYLTLNFKKAEAYSYLRTRLKVPMDQINAGYEVNLWHEGKYVVSYEPVFLHSHNYLIQYRIEPGFKILKEYEFQRYFPYKKDKIYIFVRQEKK